MKNKTTSDEKKKEEEKKNDDEEVAIALVAECYVGDRKFKAGETWTDPKHDCRMSICNPGGVISYLQCPQFELEEGDEIRIPGDSKYAYPHCCDYAFRTKKKENEEEAKEEEVKENEKEDKNEGERDEEEGGGENGGREKEREGDEEGEREEENSESDTPSQEEK